MKFTSKFLVNILVFSIFQYISTKKSNLQEENSRGNAAENKYSDRIQKTIDAVYRNLQKTQSTEDAKFRFFPPRMAENKGLYRSYIHLNVMDSRNSFPSKAVRTYIKVPDSNMFVSNFVIYALLESYEYGGLIIDNKSLKLGLSAIMEFLDKTYDKKVPIYTFWMQEYENGTWAQRPENICQIVKTIPSIPQFLINLFTNIGMTSFADFLNTVNGHLETFSKIYRIPPDTDDTAINVALTGLIHKLKNKIDSNVADSWLENNSDYKSLFKYIKYFSYRPFNFTQENLNTTRKFSNYSDLLDPRSYYMLHNFLTEKVNKKEEVILPTTWVFDYNLEKQRYPLQTMTFTINNVDFNVAANVLFGMTNIVLFYNDTKYINEAFDSEMEVMYLSVVDLIIYAIKNDIMSSRPDIAFLYYPSIFDFYWLASRTYSTLKNFDLEGGYFFDESIRQLLIESRDKLGETLRKEGSEQMMKLMKKDKNGHIYFMEFLGNYAGYNRGEDTAFSTGLAFNSFLNIWTVDVRDESGEISKIIYDFGNKSQEEADMIKQTIIGISEYILNNINSHFTSFENAFFSGSSKSKGSWAYFYPSNFNQYLNGTQIEDTTDDSKIAKTLTSGVRGYMPDKEFKKQVNEIHYGRYVETEFKGYNPNVFPYWSSPAITHAVNLLGLSKFKRLSE